jgi:RNA polymerase sigma factor (sigma-70 family)
VKNFLLFPKKAAPEKEVWFRHCLVQNESRLIRYVKSLVRNLEVSKDIVQDSFLKLWNQDYMALKGHEAQWLFTISRNQAYDYLRKKRRQQNVSDELVTEVADSSPNAEHQLTQLSSEEILSQLIKDLTPAQREVMELKFQQGLSYKEISAITGHSVNHVGVLIHNIVNNLKEKMRSL